ncbi:DUF4147 domain-containing protein [Candidatus Wolfebacteria bacterium]|nr:DUF4147 domain-containing protein [Candidatus Wolfebacteria bacterium]
MITNFKDLAKTPLREKALKIAEAGYRAIEIESAILRKVSLKKDRLVIKHFGSRGLFFDRGFKIDLAKFQKVFLVGIGKGSSLASNAIANILGERLEKGIALDIGNPQFEIRNLKLEILKGTHPLPSEPNIVATKEIIKLAQSLTKEDLLLVFVGGGGSSLTCVSEEELKDSSLITKELTKAGANIEELNTVRKHLSILKGGGLVKMASRATIVSLIVSDVCGNHLGIIASGPTVFDETTKADAETILKKYNLNPADFHLIETPKEKALFKKTTNMLFVCNQDAVMAMLAEAEKLGFLSKIYSLALEGEAKDIFEPMLRNIKSNQVFLAAGETTVTIKNHKLGKGGRNMEAVLGAICSFESGIKDGAVMMSFASDGHDATEAAGAIADAKTIEAARNLNLDKGEFLDNHDSFHFFEKTGDLLFVEPKSFNVADLMVVLKI